MKKRIRWLCISGAICLLCIIAMVYVLMQGPRQEVRFTPPSFDAAAVQGTPSLTENDGYRGIDATVYSFALCGDIYIADGAETVDVWFTSSADNDAWLKLELFDMHDNLLGETGLIRAGEYVQSIALTSVPDKSTDVRLVIMGYEPDTYYSVGNVTLYTTLYNYNYDINAVEGAPDLTEEDSYYTLSDGIITFSICNASSPEADNSLDVWLTNGESNDSLLKLLAIDDNDALLGETGVIRPGEYVRSMTLTALPGENVGVRLMAVFIDAQTHRVVEKIEIPTMHWPSPDPE